MFDAKAVKRSFSDAAEAYNAHAHLQQKVRAHCIDLAMPFWPDDSHILDAGCGTGALGAEIEKWRITGLDLAPGMCRCAHIHTKDIVNADAGAMPFKDRSFDGIFSSLMLQWANDMKQIFGEMQRVLTSMGYIVISSFTSGTLLELQQAFATIDSASHVSRFYSVAEIEQFAQQAGFSVVSKEQVLVQEYVPDAATLMRSLQAIGATHKDTGRRKGLLTARKLAALEESYGQFLQKEGLPVSWQLLYLVLRKD